MAEQQINPPFDGSAPCPMCSCAIRNVVALMHNTLNRMITWRGEPNWEPKALVKLWGLSEANPAALKSDHLDVQRMLDEAAKVVETWRRVCTIDGSTVRCSDVPALQAHAEPMRQAMIPIGKLSDGHFDDARHATGRENVIREERGGRAYWDGTYAEYHLTVDVAHKDATQADLTHQPCGTGLILHGHFRERLARDPEFYGKVWCPACRIDAPRAQFK